MTLEGLVLTMAGAPNSFPGLYRLQTRWSQSTFGRHRQVSTKAVSHRENLVCGLQTFNQEINQVE